MTGLGSHLLVEVWGEVNSSPFFDMERCSENMIEAAKAAGATVLDGRWHHFGEGCGYTGVVVLAESHISVHTWPEKGYAAVDVFMCGKADPLATLDTITAFFNPTHIDSIVLLRGIIVEEGQQSI